MIATVHVAKSRINFDVLESFWVRRVNLAERLIETTQHGNNVRVTSDAEVFEFLNCVIVEKLHLRVVSGVVLRGLVQSEDFTLLN